MSKAEKGVALHEPWTSKNTSVAYHITRTSLFKYTENFTTKKMKVFRWKILNFFIFLLKT